MKLKFTTLLSTLRLKNFATMRLSPPSGGPRIPPAVSPGGGSGSPPPLPWGSLLRSRARGHLRSRAGDMSHQLTGSSVQW